MNPSSICRRRSPAAHRQRQPRGAVLFAALACLLIVMSILGSMLQGALRARRQLHVERNCRQTECLLQAGLERAAYRLANEADYRGETWKLKIAPAAALSNADQHDAQVVIEASPTSDGAPWEVSIVAEFPYGDERSVRRSRTFVVHAPTTSTQE